MSYSLIVMAEKMNVPDDYSTIQGAIDAAGNGDVIVVYPGTYYESINFLAKAITLRNRHCAAKATIRPKLRHPE